MDLPTQYPPVLLAIARPYMISIMASTPLYGIAIAQTTYYYRTFPKDRKFVKIMVGILMALDTAHMACIIKSSGDWLQVLVERAAPLLPMSFEISLYLTYTVICLVQCSYAIRLWILSTKNWAVTAVVVSFALGQLGGGMGQAIEIMRGQNANVAHLSKTFRIAGITELSCSFVCDTVIASAMVYFLKAPGRTNHITAQVVNKLVIYSINVGAVTSVVTAVNLVLWLVMPQNFNFLIFHLILSKLYLNSLLVMLNSRAKLRQQLNRTDHISLNSRRTAETDANA
ncbi:hypothetical protein B0H10DRAFT_1212747 [Mycena sp. CBHHK59/15]|nr:hypothetical protein B0H10DRAFT_1212747 [Mycena sp. CBHHK59/15]